MKFNILAFTTLFLGIVSIILCFVPFINFIGLILSIFTIFFGIKTRNVNHQFYIALHSNTIIDSGITFGIIGIIIFIINSTIMMVSVIPL